jgi:hypothetical protein
MAVSSPSTFFGVSMPTSRCGTLAAVTRPNWAPSGVDIDHFIPRDDEALAVVESWARRGVPGSYIAITHGSADRMSDEARETASLYNRSVASLTMRTHDEVVALFTGETLVEPGVVQIPCWRPDQPDEFGADVARYPGYAGVARIN